MNKIFYPVGTTFLEHEADRAIFYDLRGGEVVAVDVFDKGDTRGGVKSITVILLCCDYQGYICCKAMTGPAFHRLVLAAKLDMSTGKTATQVREEAAIHDLNQAPVQLSKLQAKIQASADEWLELNHDRLVRGVAQGGCGVAPELVSKSGWFEREPAHLRTTQQRLTAMFPAGRRGSAGGVSCGSAATQVGATRSSLEQVPLSVQERSQERGQAATPAPARRIPAGLFGTIESMVSAFGHT